MKWILMLSILAGSLKSGSTQKFEKTYLLSGKIVDSTTQMGLPNVLLTIVETRESLFTDSLGNFELLLSINRHIKVSSLGYHSKILHLNDVFTKENNFTAQITLKVNPIALKEVIIHPLGTWEDFKENFIKENISNEEYWKTKHLYEMMKDYYTAIPDTANYGFIPLKYSIPKLSPVYPLELLYYILATNTKKHKTKKEVYRMIKRMESLENNKFNYNEALLAEVLQLQNTDSLKLFKNYCDEYIKLDNNQTDYNFIQQIKHLYNRYKNRKL